MNLVSEDTDEHDDHMNTLCGEYTLRNYTLGKYTVEKYTLGKYTLGKYMLLETFACIKSKSEFFFMKIAENENSCYAT